MPFQRQPHFVRAHAVAVVHDFDEACAPAGQPDRNVASTRIERVFDQFLERARGPLDDLSRGDSINKFGRQSSY